MQRPLFFSKYLSELGWKCIVLTTAEDDYPLRDDGLKRHVHKTTLIRRVNDPKVSDKIERWSTRTDQKIARLTSRTPMAWRLANVLSKTTRTVFRPVIRALSIPDKLIGGLPKLLWNGHKLIQAEKPDIIFATSPPPTMLITGMVLAKIHNLPWVADLRDEWTLNPNANHPNRLYKWLDQAIEKSILTRADKIITTTPLITTDTARQTGCPLSLFETITNGHTLDTRNKTTTPPLSQSINLLYSGVLPKGRSPASLIDAFSDIVKSDSIDHPKFLLHFAGYIDPYKVILAHRFVKQHGYLSHSTLLKFFNESHVLVLITGQNEQRSYAGKIFEYLATGKPLLIVCPFESATYHFFKDISPHIYLADINDVKMIKANLLKILQLSNKGNLPEFIDRPEARKYHRRELTKKLDDVLTDLLPASKV